MRRWLARLSFSFMIVGAVLLWEAFKVRPGPWRAPEITAQRKIAYVVCGALSLGVGLAGVRARHGGSREE